LNFRGRGQGQGLVVRGQGQGRGLELQGQGLENWSSRILEDKDFPRGQQHWHWFVSDSWAFLFETQCSRDK